MKQKLSFLIGNILYYVSKSLTIFLPILEQFSKIKKGSVEVDSIRNN